MADSNITAIVEGRVCCGCGACFVACPTEAVKIVAGEHYNYARVSEHLCTYCGLCLDVCPQRKDGPQKATSNLAEPRACYLAHASDDVVRREGSSGGFVTALLVDLVESGAITGAAVVRASAESPFLQESFVARAREEVSGARGSRYTPVSMCVALAEVRERPGRYAFVGKPCEVRALRRLQDRFPELRERVVLAVGVFCAQTPARSRTKAFLESRGIDPQEVHAVAYRGAGWPGRFRAWNATGIVCEVPYREAWDFLAAGTQGVACLLCSDGVAAEADVSAGDPWFLAAESPMGDGRTLVAVWTDPGKEAVAGAASAGTIVPNELEGEWRAKLCHAQALRSATAAHRRAVYGVVFGERRSLLGLLRSRLTCLPTLVRRRLARAYY